MEVQSDINVDVVVVGAGNAAMCAALSAHEKGAEVLVLERSTKKERGGNTTFTAGGFRFAYSGLDQLIKLVPDLSEEEKNNTDFGTYTEEQYYDDLCQTTDYLTDPELADLLVSSSFETMRWLQSKNIRFMPMYGRQAFKVDGKFKFWGGEILEVVGGGPGLVDSLHETAEKEEIKVLYETRAVDLITNNDIVCGVRAKNKGETVEIKAGSVILASGGFQSNTEMRTRYLGPNWDLAKVRGTRFDTGDGINMALKVGAMPYGNWSGSHAVAWERYSPEFGDLAVGDSFQKHSYPFGVLVNAKGERFFDEGSDFPNYTYAKVGGEILAQPKRFAWQVFDQKVNHLLRDEYRIKQVTKVKANSLEELANKLDDVDPKGFLKMIKEYNESIEKDIPFNPNIKDGRTTKELEIPKSNWANTIDEPPFEAYAVTCGLTSTFGGIKINQNAEVQDTEGKTIPGLYATGELVGGIFYFNYPGGSGLMFGSIFGKIAGQEAGNRILKNKSK